MPKKTTNPTTWRPSPRDREIIAAIMDAHPYLISQAQALRFALEAWAAHAWAAQNSRDAQEQAIPDTPTYRDINITRG